MFYRTKYGQGTVLKVHLGSLFLPVLSILLEKSVLHIQDVVILRFHIENVLAFCPRTANVRYSARWGHVIAFHTLQQKVEIGANMRVG